MNKIKKPIFYSSISEFHSAHSLQKPLHPLFSIFELNTTTNEILHYAFVADFYLISYKTNLKGKVKYGQNYYDFDEGGLLFFSPNQLVTIDGDDCGCNSINILIHSDNLRHNSLEKKITAYEFFSYATNESLHLSTSEKTKILTVFKDIEEEILHPIDDVSQDLIISYLDLLLNYSNRFYKRQFVTRKPLNDGVLKKFENLLLDYFEKRSALDTGLPTVKYFSAKLNLSSGYLSELLRSLPVKMLKPIFRINL